MKRIALVLFGAAALLVASCHDTGMVDSESASSRVELTSSPAAPYAGEPVALTVTAHNDQTAIRTVAIDFTGDGTLDETQSFDAHAIAATFTHAYPATGTYDVHVAVTDASGAAMSTSAELTVTTAPTTVPVAFVILGFSQEDGRCYAVDPPGTCVGCARIVGAESPLPATISMGQQPHGAKVSVNQGFRQSPVVFNNQRYGCQFRMRVVSGAPGHEQSIGTGACETSSLVTRSEQLKCWIAISGTVP